MCQAVLTEGEGDRMLTYQMEERGGMSLYDYLYSCIKADIFNGKLTANEKLPSKRSLAKNLGISVITVENAYSQLNAEGFIYSIEKKGYYVAELSKWVQSGSISQKTPEKSCNCEELCKKHIYADFVSNAGRKRKVSVFTVVKAYETDIVGAERNAFKKRRRLQEYMS